MTEIGDYKHFNKFHRMFEDIKWCIFMIDISKYDQYSLSTCKVTVFMNYLNYIDFLLLILQNLLNEAIDEFKIFATSSHTKDVSFVIFFNKFDIFKKKIIYSPLKYHFPNYKGNH